MILRYKLQDLIKIYDDFINDSIKRDFQKTLLLFQIGRKSLGGGGINGFGCIQYINCLIDELGLDHHRTQTGNSLCRLSSERIINSHEIFMMSIDV